MTPRHEAPDYDDDPTGEIPIWDDRPPPGPPPESPAYQREQFWQKWWFWLLVFFMVCAIAGQIAKGHEPVSTYSPSTSCVTSVPASPSSSAAG